jgi:hypothetical protein
MRGLMAKPQKSGSTGGEIIENPILSNFKEGLSILSISFLPTVHVKVLPILPLKQRMRVT